MLEIKNLTVKFDQKTVLKDISVTFPKDSLTTIIGPSGIGKSTFLAAICQQLNYQGKILFNKTPLSLKKETIAVVPQDYGLFPWMTVQKNIELGLKIRNKHQLSTQNLAHLQELINSLDISDLLFQYPDELSGGQKRRVAIAKAFAMDPDLILLDEAFSALDTVVKNRAHELMLLELKKQPTTTIMVTHDLSEALTFSDQIFILSNDGYELMFNPLKDIAPLNREKDAKFFDLMMKLKNRIENHGKKVRNFIIAILILNILWYVAALGVRKDILPSPIAVYQTLPGLLRSSDVGLDIYASLYRIFWGLLSATGVGIILGVILARSKKFAKIANPILYFLYPIPKISLLPILMLFLGLGEVSKIGMLFLANVFQVIISVRDQVKQVPESYYRNLQILNANRWNLFRYITWPASLSGVFSAMRIELSASFAILFMTEVYGTQYGLGYYIMDEWSKMEYLKMYGGIIILSIIAFIIFIGIDVCDHHFNKWRKNK